MSCPCEKCESLRKLIRKHKRAMVAYNRDCNMRAPLKPGDTKNNKLMWESVNAFNEMIAELDRVFKTPSKLHGKRSR